VFFDTILKIAFTAIVRDGLSKNSANPNSAFELELPYFAKLPS
jgi:hypothetical protein